MGLMSGRRRRKNSGEKSAPKVEEPKVEEKKPKAKKPKAKPAPELEKDDNGSDGPGEA